MGSMYRDDDYYQYNEEEEAESAGYESHYRSMMGFDDEMYYDNAALEDAEENVLDEFEDSMFIDSFYDDMDGAQWFVMDRVLEDDELADRIRMGFDGAQDANDNELFSFSNVFQTTTETNNEVKRRCLVLFGAKVCLCEFVNGVADPDGLTPLYECDAKPFLQTLPRQAQVVTRNVKAAQTQKTQTAKQTAPKAQKVKAVVQKRVEAKKEEESKESESESESESKESTEEGGAEKKGDDDDDDDDGDMSIIIIVTVACIFVCVIIGACAFLVWQGTFSLPSFDNMFGSDDEADEADYIDNEFDLGDGF